LADFLVGGAAQALQHVFEIGIPLLQGSHLLLNVKCGSTTRETLECAFGQNALEI
jgi:hypothetical protein